jgi:hypothetical protein
MDLISKVSTAEGPKQLARLWDSCANDQGTQILDTLEWAVLLA